MAGTSSTNAWAVGHTSAHGTLIGHWNGKAWKLQPHPNPGIHAFLLGVAAASRTNAWAVGYNKNISAHTAATLIEHWNGKAWKVQQSPNVGPLAAVTATSPNNAWATGGHVILHWNGKG